MKKGILLLILISIFCFPLTETTSASNLPEGITITKSGYDYIINFNLPQYRYETLSAKGEEYYKILISGYGTTSEPGLPGLPLAAFNLQIPAGEQSPQFEIISADKIDQTIPKEIYPFQEPWPKNFLLDDRPFTKNIEYYKTSGTPLPFVKISDTYIIGGAKGIMVAIYPFSYNPVENKLAIIRHGSFKIKLNNNVESSERHSKSFNNYLNSFFVNFQKGIPAGASNYLIITPAEYQSTLQPFIDHKISCGFNVDVFTTAETGTTNTQIKDFIQNRYDDINTRPEFILLVGDVNVIPIWTTTEPDNPITDLFYALLDGTDFYADASIGRFSVTNTTQLENAINKTIYMENNIAVLDKQNVFMASSDNYTISEGTHNFVINSYFDPADYNNLKLYSHTYNATTQQLIDALNSNKLFAIYSGHGSTTSWADGPPLNQSQVSALVNTVYPFVYSFACLTGEFDYGECFGETWLRTSHGGSSFYGSSVTSYWDEDDILERRIFQAMFVDGITKVTPMFNLGKAYLADYYGGFTSTVKRYFEMYNLMGDPSLETVMQIPPDSTAPEPVTNLSTVDPTSNSITLNWTAPYDSTFGGITSYDIRYSTQMINNDEDFNNAQQIMWTGQSDSTGTQKSYKVDELEFSTTYYFAIKSMDMWGNKSVMSNVPYLPTYGAPQIAVNPDSMICSMPQETTETDTVIISNISSGNSTLDYSIELTNNIFPANSFTYKLKSIQNEIIDPQATTKNNPLIIHGSGGKGSGGPDNFGYTWIDSDEPNGPEYVWNDISTTGNLISNWIAAGYGDPRDDGYAGPFPIGFNFKYYGNVKTQLYVQTNGFITFQPVTDNWYTNEQIPSTDAPNEIICPFWDDLDGRTQGDVYYKQDGNKFIIQYNNWQLYSGTGSLTFQIVLYSNGKILFYYNNLVGTLNACTVGIENADGTDGLQTAYNSTYLKNNFAVQITAEPDWLIPDHLSGTIYNGNSAAVILTFDTQGLDVGNYSMDMVISSNDPINSSVTVPIHMSVTSEVPVELNSFSAKVNSNEVILNWRTATETNNKGFNIQRLDNENEKWKSISFVNGNGTTVKTSSYLYKDKINKPGKYQYRLEQIDFNGKSEYSQTVNAVVTGPDKFELLQNYPNPFNPVTKINYALPVKSEMTLKILNILGQEVAEIVNQTQESGYYDVSWQPKNITSGIYIYVLDAKPVDGKNVSRIVKKMVYMK